MKQRHLKTDENDESSPPQQKKGGVSCPIDGCNQIIASKYNLKNHLKTHQNRTYTCEYCSKPFTSESSWVLHLKSHTDGITCPIEGCNKIVSSKSNLQIHMTTHQINKFMCEHCSKIFTSEISLSRHLKIHTDGPKSFQCDICERTLTTRTTLIFHRRTHTGERPAQCEQCGKNFVCTRDLNVHRGRHHQDLQIKYICKLCGKKYQIYGKLKQHYIQYHPTSEVPGESVGDVK